MNDETLKEVKKTQRIQYWSTGIVCANIAITVDGVAPKIMAAIWLGYACVTYFYD